MQSNETVAAGHGHCFISLSIQEASGLRAQQFGLRLECPVCFEDLCIELWWVHGAEYRVLIASSFRQSTV